MLFVELSLRFYSVNTHAKNEDVAKVCSFIPKAACFKSSAGGVGLGIKEKDGPFSANHLLGNGLAMLIAQ